MGSTRGLGAAIAAATLLGAAAPAGAGGDRDVVYVELGGKGGLWGLGYDHQHRPWLGGGLTASFYVLDDQRVGALSPYLSLHPVGRGRHRWFVHAGPQLVHVATPSPVPEWSGTASTGLGAQLSTGYEYRHGVLLRLSAMVAAGEGGVVPWLGVSLGWTL